MPAKESMMILRPRSHGGGTGGSQSPTFLTPFSRLPYLFVPLSPDSRPLLCFSRYHVNHAVWLPILIGRALALSKTPCPLFSRAPAPLSPSTHTNPDIFENGDFFLPFSENWASTRSVLESFSPIIHTKTLKRWKLDSNSYRACAVWRMTSSHLKISRKPHENDKDWFPLATEPEL